MGGFRQIRAAIFHVRQALSGAAVRRSQAAAEFRFVKGDFAQMLPGMPGFLRHGMINWSACEVAMKVARQRGGSHLPIVLR
jgi:hypothetical protein